MKTLIWSIVTIILWIGVALRLECDYREHNAAFLSALSPLQWFMLSMLIWLSVSALNLWILAVKCNVTDVRIQAINIYVQAIDIVLCVVPITQFVILIMNVSYLLKGIFTPVEQPNPNKLFEEEFMKDKK